jgi:hypothetical protein
MCHGGQRYLGRPQILDCGEHLLFENFYGVTTTKYTRRIIQLVPSESAFDFFGARGSKEVPSQAVVK